MSSRVGKFIVYQGTFTDRYMAGEITKETKSTFEVLRIGGERSTRKIKSSLGILSWHDTADQAEYVAKSVSDRLMALRDRYNADRVEIIQAYKGAPK